MRQNEVEYVRKGSKPDCGQCSWLEGGLRTCAILPKWFLLTRLETRTKESNICASVRVEKLIREMKVKGAQAQAAASTDLMLDERFEYEHIC